MLLRAKNRSTNKTPEQLTNGFVIERACNPYETSCTPEQASHLLEKLGKTYRVLVSRDQKPVRASIRGSEESHEHTGIRMTIGHDGVSGGKVNEVLRQVFANRRMNVTFDGTYERVARPEF